MCWDTSGLLAQGGKFEHGFFSGFVSSLGGSYIMGIENTGVQVLMSAVIGGTAESLGGGKFANGAVTGAYVMMFNHLMSQQQDRARRELQAKTNKLVLGERNRAIKNLEALEFNRNNPDPYRDAQGGLDYNINYDFDISGLKYGTFYPFEGIIIELGSEVVSVDIYYLRSRSSIVTDINWFTQQPASYVSPGSNIYKGYLVEFRNKGNLTLGLIRFNSFESFDLFRSYTSGK
jgi:hypothetical protein